MIFSEYQLNSLIVINSFKSILPISNEQKKIRINELKINKLSELFKYIKIVYFSPRDIDFSAGNPGFRRNFFDLAISQNSFQYIETLKEYNRILKQRNALFKTDYLKSEKDSWDDRFVKTGTAR